MLLCKKSMGSAKDATVDVQARPGECEVGSGVDGIGQRIVWLDKKVVGLGQKWSWSTLELSVSIRVLFGQQGSLAK